MPSSAPPHHHFPFFFCCWLTDSVVRYRVQLYPMLFVWLFICIPLRLRLFCCEWGDGGRSSVLDERVPTSSFFVFSFHGPGSSLLYATMHLRRGVIWHVRLPDLLTDVVGLSRGLSAGTPIGGLRDTHLPSTPTRYCFHSLTLFVVSFETFRLYRYLLFCG